MTWRCLGREAKGRWSILGTTMAQRPSHPSHACCNRLPTFARLHGWSIMGFFRNLAAIGSCENCDGILCWWDRNRQALQNSGSRDLGFSDCTQGAELDSVANDCSLQWLLTIGTLSSCKS